MNRLNDIIMKDAISSLLRQHRAGSARIYLNMGTGADKRLPPSGRVFETPSYIIFRLQRADSARNDS